MMVLPSFLFSSLGRYYKFIQKGDDHMNDENQAFLSDEDMIAKVDTLMDRINRNQQLQELSQRNGLDVKNSLILTEDTTNNIAVSVISLLLAQRSNDPRYQTLKQAGLQRRTVKADIINSYKDQANQLIARYKAVH